MNGALSSSKYIKSAIKAVISNMTRCKLAAQMAII